MAGESGGASGVRMGVVGDGVMRVFELVVWSGLHGSNMRGFDSRSNAWPLG